jgi:hypothetical protein
MMSVVHLIATGMYVVVELTFLCLMSPDFVSSSYPCGPCILSILPNNCAGHYKKATAVALQLAIANCGYESRRLFVKSVLMMVAQRVRRNFRVYLG